MSYLLDALRKAEQERNLGRVPDLTYAQEEPDRATRRGPQSWVIWLVVALVLINLAALASFWWFARPANNLVAPVAADTALVNPAPGTVLESQPEPEPPAASTPTVVAPQPAAAAVVAKSPNKPSPATASAPAKAPNIPNPPVLEEHTPEAPAEFETEPHFKALAATQREGIPSLEISGHLYSSIPGRSFVLVNGRRFHEGQRLPQGPAIVLIDPQGAVFNYQDTRFRLDAPR